jgi:hypothetical protein
MYRNIPRALLFAYSSEDPCNNNHAQPSSAYNRLNRGQMDKPLRKLVDIWFLAGLQLPFVGETEDVQLDVV